jgi:hypothetical protein
MHYTLYKVQTSQGSWRMRVPWGNASETIERQLPDESWADRRPGTREVPTQVCEIHGAKGAAMALCWEMPTPKVLNVEEVGA